MARPLASEKAQAARNALLAIGSAIAAVALAVGITVLLAVAVISHHHAHNRNPPAGPGERAFAPGLPDGIADPWAAAPLAPAIVRGGPAGEAQP